MSLKVFNSLEEYNLTQKTCVTIGTFDGVHKGHQKVLSHLVTTAKNDGLTSVLLTFFPHPRMVLQHDASFKLINTIEERMELLEQTGLEVLIIQEFSKEFSQQSALFFVREVLVNKLSLKKLIIGYDHRFGKNREGDFEHLQEYGHTYDFQVLKITQKEVDDMTVSSTKIRNALNEGQMQKVHAYLGYVFSFSGEVINGKKLGSTIGFPTANIKISADYKMLPKDGVYAVSVNVGGELLLGMMNIGCRPTVDGSNKNIEVHLFNYNKNIYGKEVVVIPMHFLRNEKKFSSIETLKEQLKKDKIHAIELLK